LLLLANWPFALRPLDVLQQLRNAFGWPKWLAQEVCARKLEDAPKVLTGNKAVSERLWPTFTALFSTRQRSLVAS